MLNNANISNSAVKTFEILKKLSNCNCTKNELLNDFSEDTLTLYLNSLRQIGFKVLKPCKNSKVYKLNITQDLLDFTDDDIELLIKIKSILAKYNSYQDIINFNNFIIKYIKSFDGILKNKFSKVVNAKPFGENMHKQIFELENFIKSKTPLEITYCSPSSRNSCYKILPLYLKMQNSKLYLWGKDNSLADLRCLKFDRIKDYKPICEIFKNTEVENIAICEFALENQIHLNIFENYEVVEKTDKSIVVKIEFYNSFEFLQKVLYFGKDCKIIEPSKLRNELYKKIKLIEGNYGK